MQNELSLLLKLQEHDTAIDALVEKVQEFDESIQTKNKQADTVRASLKTAKETLTAHQLKKKQLEAEAEAKEQVIKKHQGELNSLKSNDAYKAMLSEIDQAKEALKKIEDDILSVMEAIDKEDKEFKAIELKIKNEEGAIKNEVKNLEGQKAAVSVDQAAKQQERDTFAATVPENIKSQYDAIRKKRGGKAIAPIIHGNVCSGCRLNLPPNKVNDIKKAKAMIMCDSCSRILYMVPADAPATPAAS